MANSPDALLYRYHYDPLDRLARRDDVGLPRGCRHLALDLRSLPGFNGEPLDPVTGHYLLGNGYRAFNPVLMRFNSPDSESPFEWGGINAYAYCDGDPVNRVDPSGHVPSIWKGMKKFLGLRTLNDSELESVVNVLAVYQKKSSILKVQASEINPVYRVTDKTIRKEVLGLKTHEARVDYVRQKYDNIIVEQLSHPSDRHPVLGAIYYHGNYIKAPSAIRTQEMRALRKIRYEGFEKEAKVMARGRESMMEEVELIRQQGQGRRVD